MNGSTSEMSFGFKAAQAYHRGEFGNIRHANFDHGRSAESAWSAETSARRGISTPSS
jgi:hypothetical protein